LIWADKGCTIRKFAASSNFI